jgi:peptide/nickel transport system permease protein
MGPADVADMRAKLGLDHGIAIQFVVYAKQILSGDLGQSFITGRPVAQDLAQRLPASLELAVCGFALATLVALPLGVAAALKPGGLVDHACRAMSVLGGALPGFVTGLALIYVFYFRLGWASEPTGMIDAMIPQPAAFTGLPLIDAAISGDAKAFISAAGKLALPSLTMAIFALAPLARITRSAMIETLSSDYILSARALGLRPATVVIRYGLGNALLPVLTLLGMVFSSMLGANVVVEKVFAWPGVGSYAIDALQGADYAAVQGFVLAVAAVFTAVNLIVDILCLVVDPRSARTA